MKKKGLIITLSIVGAIILLVAIGFGILFLSGNQITTARCIVTDNGTLYMVYDERPIRLNYSKKHDYKTGEELLVIHQSAFAESYPEQCKAYLILKVGNGTAADVPQHAFDVLNSLRVDSNGTPLEFFLKQNVENYNFEGHDEITGWFGAREYLGSEYEKITGADGTDSKPEYYVSYLVTAYPDYADGGAYITEIRITDPKVYLYGLTVQSAASEFYSVFMEMGFTITEEQTSSCVMHIAEKDGVKCTKTVPKPGADDVTPELVIKAEVTNKTGIVY